MSFDKILTSNEPAPYTPLPDARLEQYRIIGQRLVQGHSTPHERGLGQIICDLSAEIEELKIEVGSYKRTTEALRDREKRRKEEYASRTPIGRDPNG